MPVADIIRAAMDDPGLSDVHVVWVPGWESRGRPGTFEPAGVVCHHTATSRYAAGDYPSLGIVRDGRADLAGPLAQFGLGRSGTVYVIAAGKANHAGSGGWAGLSGNATVWGIEAENDGIGEPWPIAQVGAYIALVAALARATGFGASMVCRHAEWSTAGKIDTATAPMNDGDWLRAQVQSRLDNPFAPPPAPVPKEDDMASPFILLSYGSGVALWHPSGDVVPLASSKQVLDALARGDIVMDDLTAEQVATITGATTALAASSELAEYLPAGQEPLGCAARD